MDILATEHLLHGTLSALSKSWKGSKIVGQQNAEHLIKKGENGQKSVGSSCLDFHYTHPPVITSQSPNSSIKLRCYNPGDIWHIVHLVLKLSHFKQVPFLADLEFLTGFN